MKFPRVLSSAVSVSFLLGAALTGCGPGGKVAAVVNGQVITVKELDDRVAKMSAADRQSPGESRPRVLEQMIMESLLIQEARRRGLENDREVKHLIREARRQILFGRLVEQLREEQSAQVGDPEVAAYFEANRADFAEPESTRASHILVNDEETAKKALARVRAGEDFAKVAEEMSTDPSKSNGGDIGFFAKGQVIPEFEEACRKLKTGETSDVVKSSLGYHVIRVEEKKEAHQRTLDEVKDRIRKGLEQQQRQKHLEQVVHDLRSKAQVMVKDKSPAAPASPAPSQETPGS